MGLHRRTHLPRQIIVGQGGVVTTYSDWNVPMNMRLPTSYVEATKKDNVDSGISRGRGPVWCFPLVFRPDRASPLARRLRDLRDALLAQIARGQSGTPVPAGRALPGSHHSDE